MTESLFGPLISTWPIERQVIDVYETWTHEYLSELERKEGLQRNVIPRPPSPESYHGGIDFLSWKREELPKVIVVVEPTGQPERDASVGYSQWYEVQVGCIVAGVGGLFETLLIEDEARALAGYYGAMSMLLADQPPALAEDIFMVESPRPTFPNPDDRLICQSTTAFHMLVGPIKLLAAGPTQPQPSESPEYEGPGEPWKPEPTATSVHTTVNAEPI
jgi:hypothetical protein